MLLDTIPSLGSELSGCCVYASWEAAPTLNRGKRDTKPKNFLSLSRFILTHFVVVLLPVGLYLKPINGGTFYALSELCTLSYKTWYIQLPYVMFCSIFKEPLCPVKYVSFVHSWCFSSLVEQCK